MLHSMFIFRYLMFSAACCWSGIFLLWFAVFHISRTRVRQTSMHSRLQKPFSVLQRCRLRADDHCLCQVITDNTRADNFEVKAKFLTLLANSPNLATQIGRLNYNSTIQFLPESLVLLSRYDNARMCLHWLCAHRNPKVMHCGILFNVPF